MSGVTTIHMCTYPSTPMIRFRFSDLILAISLAMNVEYTGLNDKDKVEQLFRVRRSHPTSLVSDLTRVWAYYPR